MRACNVRARWGLLLLLLGCLLSAPPARAQAPTVEALAARLEEAATLLEAGEVGAARALLRSLDRVSFGEGEELSFPGTFWAEQEALPAAEQARLLRQVAATLRAPPTALPADARERLDHILARPEFRPAAPSWQERLLQWLSERFPSLDGVPGGESVGRLLGWLIVGASALIILAVLLSFLRGLRHNLDGEEPAAPLPGDVPRRAAEAQAQASEAAGAGNFREAMRLLYLAALLHLDESGLIRFDRALTNREVLASVADNPSLRPLLAPVVAQFDQVWYGHAPFGQAEFERVREQIERLRALEPPR